MRFALVNPAWDGDGAYFGCREPHLPLELSYAKALLARQGHDVLLLDAHLFVLSPREVRERVAAFRPQVTVLTTAPSCLYSRWPLPELHVPQELARALQGVGGALVAVGPHPSATPSLALRQLPVGWVVRGEFEDWLPQLAEVTPDEWHALPGIAYRMGQQIEIVGDAHEADVYGLPALHWPAATIQAHRHQHGRFDAAPLGPGAEMETSRGCPDRCSLHSRERVRASYRQRPLDIVLEELDGLLAQGVEYVYFADEIFMPDAELLLRLAERHFKFGIRTRIDLWDVEMLDLLGLAGCHALEAEVESVTEEGRQRLNQRCSLSTTEITRLLARAKMGIPFVEATLVAIGEDEPEIVATWRRIWASLGIWTNEPVPISADAGSPGLGHGAAATERAQKIAGMGRIRGRASSKESVFSGEQDARVR